MTDNMSKEQSTILKGIAILLMLIFHLFNHEEILTLCTPLIYINDKPLITYLVKASNPVAFFMILSGYGLTYLYTHNRLNLKDQIRRLLRLYIHYWVVLAIFVSIGHYINPNIYPHSFIHLLGNISGLFCSYNGETWFLLPYSIVCMSSYRIIKHVYNMKSRKIIITTILCYAIVFLSARHLGYNLPGNKLLDTLLIQPVYWVQLTFYFSLGILLYRLLEKEPKLIKNASQSIYILLLCLAIVIKSQFKITIADGLYAFMFIFCFLHIKINGYLASVLHELGRCSMPMWMTHTFFCVYLFPDFIYGFKYPLLIFTVLVLISYLTAIPIMWIGKKIINCMRI